MRAITSWYCQQPKLLFAHRAANIHSNALPGCRLLTHPPHTHVFLRTSAKLSLTACCKLLQQFDTRHQLGTSAFDPQSKQPLLPATAVLSPKDCQLFVTQCHVCKMPVCFLALPGTVPVGSRTDKSSDAAKHLEQTTCTAPEYVRKRGHSWLQKVCESGLSSKQGAPLHVPSQWVSAHMVEDK